VKTPARKEDVLSDFKIFETDQFSSDLNNIGKNLSKKIYNKIQNYIYPLLRVNPFPGKNIRKIANYNPPTWRYRIGDYRLFYEVDQDEKIVYLIAMELRSKAY